MDDLLFGLRTTALGMGIVFGVLAILWALLSLTPRVEGWLARRAALAAVAAGAGADAVVEAAEQDAGSELPAGAGAAVGPVAGGPGTVETRVDGRTLRLSGDAAGLDPRLVAAIAVAILRHEEARRLQAAPAMRSYWPGSLLFASRWVAAGRTRQGQTWRRSRR